MWTIQATVIVNDRAVSIPTFYLDETVQGIVSERHAIEIAESIINPLKLPDVEVCVSALHN